MARQAKHEALAAQLEKHAAPKQAPEGAASAPAGGMILAVIELAKALRAKEWQNAFSIAVDLLTMVRDGMGTAPDGAMSALGGGEWRKKLLALLAKVLPLILDNL